MSGWAGQAGYDGPGEGVLLVHGAISRSLAAQSPLVTTERGGLLPPVDQIETVSRQIAVAVARAAIEQGVAPALDDETLMARIEKTWWQADYAPYRRSAL